MLIGELAKKAGLTRGTVRFYERAGLIASGEKEAGSRTYKTFDEEALKRLLLIKGSQVGGFTLREIKDILDHWDLDLDAPQLDFCIPTVKAKLAQTEEKIRSLELIRQHLERKLARVSDIASNVPTNLEG
jgi:DNA-binding transcriptional MerR regulator